MNKEKIININSKINSNYTYCSTTSLDNLLVQRYKTFSYDDCYKILFVPSTLAIFLVNKEIVSVLEKLGNNGTYENFDTNLILELINYGLIVKSDKPLKSTQVEKAIDKNSKKLFLHVAHNCNLGCPYCYAKGGNYGRNKQMMSLKTARDSIDYIMKKEPNLNEISIDFFGGEPLLNYEVIEQFVEYAEKQYCGIKFKYGTVTNGTVMNSKIKNMLKKYKFHVMITIDGPKEYHDLQRVHINGKGSFDELLKNLPDFKESANYLCARIVYGKKNSNLYKAFKFIYEKLGIHDISYRPVMTELEEYKLDQESENFAIESLKTCFDYFLERKLENKKIESKFFSEQILNLIDQKSKKSFCDFGNFISITPEGNIYPCTHFIYNDNFEVGNIYGTTEKTKVLDMCRKASLADYEPCKSCWVLKLCAGGCKGSTAFYNKDNLFTSDEYCKTRMAIAEKAIRTIVQNYKNDGLDNLKKVLLKDKDKTVEMSPNRWR